MPHRSRQQDIVQALEMGLDAYLTQLEEKNAILEVLLSSYNDGRRKTLFHTAVYLLPLEDLRMILAELSSLPEMAACSMLDRASAAAERLQKAANRRGISLKKGKKGSK